MLQHVKEVPFLSRLSRIDLAKLLADLQEVELPIGAEIGAGAQEVVYFIAQGELALIDRSAAGERPIAMVRTGEIFGAYGLSPQDGQVVRALTPVTYYQVTRQRVAQLLSADPAMQRDMLGFLSQKVRDLTTDLTKARRMLTAYTHSLWNDIAPPPSQQTASATLVVPPITKAQPQKAPAQRLSLQHPVIRSTGLALSSLLMLTVYRLLAADPVLASVTAVLLWATCNWLLNTIPDYAVGLAATAALTILGAIKPAVAFGGFASPSWMLLLGAGGIGVAVTRSGLLYRLALHMLRILPPTYPGQALALALTGIIFTPLLPSANSRVAMASPLARELAEAMHFPEQSKGAAGLALSTFLGFGLMYFIFLNGANTSLLAWSLLPKSVQDQVTWGSWFWMALPLGLFLFATCFGAILFLYRPEGSTSVSRETIGTQLKVLGALNQMERVTLWVLLAVLIGFLTQPLHGLDAAWLALGGFLVLIGTGVVDKSGIKAIDWNFLLLFGTLISLSDVTKSTGLSSLVAAWITPILAPLQHSPYLFLGAIGLLTLVIRLFVPLQPTVLLMIISLLPVATNFGYNPFTVALIVLAMSNNWFVPQQNSVYLGVYSATDEKSFTHQMAKPMAIAHALLGLLCILASVPVWQWMNLVP
ncbi:MAG TPA: SLC13 family permease [Symbiobacteriaceae bacterium]|nr:SLC13 family permease [Symbiobacteriaceae bacterium]